jgi:DNA sulfur modification protein DndD
LDLVDRLLTDLLTVERKRKVQIQSQQTRANITILEKELEGTEKKSKEIAQQKNEAQLRLKQAKKDQEKLKQDYRREGGELFEQRVIIETQLKAAQQKLFILEEQLREQAAGEAPLILLRDLLGETEKQAIGEAKNKLESGLHKVLEKRDASLLQLLKQYEVNQSALTAVEAFMDADQGKRQKYLETECYLNIDPNVFTHLRFDQVIAKTRMVIAQAEEITEEMNACEQQLASIPDPESLEGITVRLADTQKEIEKAKLRIETQTVEYDRICKKIARQKAELLQASETAAGEQFVHETTHRVLKHAERVRRTLDKFGQAVTEKHIRQLESLILDSFQQLIRKEHFINQIEIDQNNYTLTLFTPTHEKLLPESLSAGERQLLAVSILWGLSRASGRPLPAIIDTPLSRLDGKHRKNLVDNYFHQASHQVILLSTDEEINKKYHRCLKPAIGREYHIIYEEDKQSSVIIPGYFF